MPLSAGSYRGRIGDRAFFTGLGRVGVSPYAGAGPYSASQVSLAGAPWSLAGAHARWGATLAARLQPAWRQSYPQGMALAGMTLGASPIPHQRVTLPSGRTIVFY